MFLSSVQYEIPTENGFCGTGNFEDHESCTCDSGNSPITTENLETQCQSFCNEDPKCKGYAFSNTLWAWHPECKLRTVSPCPATCTKGAVGVNTEEPLVNLVFGNDYSGCYIKLGND